MILNFWLWALGVFFYPNVEKEKMSQELVENLTNLRDMTNQILKIGLESDKSKHQSWVFGQFWKSDHSGVEITGLNAIANAG